MATQNPVNWFEIPVTDMARAKTFFERVFNVTLRDFPENADMAAFPMEMHAPGCSGALVKGDGYLPAHTGPVIYFSVADIAETLSRIETAGGKVLIPKTDIGQYGHFAHFEDTEGNRLALHTMAQGM